ncbi:MAG: TonB-dependent receptor [Gallionellaceae bacterium]|nr:TonB-dependent receptor [Gallionellaceae bacterium]
MTPFDKTALAIGCALIPLPASAVEAVMQLEAVTVTAKGYAADELETPVAMTTVDRTEILRRGANNLGEALRGQPGLAVTSDGAQGQNPVIRGLKKESVVLLVDGMRLNSAQPAGAIGSFMSLGLADRVEVVKGPASVLYGTGALGGAINVLLPQAKFTEGVGLDATASYDSASSGVRGTGVMNASGGDHALMLGASLARIGNYEARGGKVDRTGYDSDSFIGQYRFRIDGAQQLRLSLQQHTDDDVWYPGSTKPYPNPQVKSTTVHSPEQERRLAEIGYSRKGAGEAPINLDVRLYRQEMERQIFSRANGTLNRDIGETRASFDTDGLDAKADWLAHPQHLLSFGVNTWQMGASPERLLPQGGNPANPLVRNDAFADARIDALGVYLQDDMCFGDLNLLAGLRRDTVKGSAASMNNGAVITGLDREDSAISGSLGAIYRVTPLLRPYANLSRAFRAGEMRERYESSPRGDGYYYLGNPQIKPEIATQFEIGLKGASDTFSYTLSAYRNQVTDYITGQPSGGFISGLPVKATVNLGRVTLTGLEAQGRWQVARGHWLTAGYSRVRGENDDLNEPLFQMPADELSLGWEGAVAQGWAADATLRLVNRQDRVATVFALGSENATPGFATADLGVTWRYAKDQTLRIALKNLADKAYHEHLAEGVSGQEIQAPGRSLALAWKGKF